MRSWFGDGIVCGVERKLSRLVIELEPGEPVSGWAAREGEPPVRFEGLLAFISLFERLRSSDEPEDRELH
jgi:hypothetical protein